MFNVSDLGSFSLNRTISPLSDSEPEDVLRTKTALSTLGHFDTRREGLSSFPDKPLFDGLKNFQKQEGLKVDGIVKPGGPTAKRMTGLLSGGAAILPDQRKSKTDPAFGKILGPATLPSDRSRVDSDWFKLPHWPTLKDEDVSSNRRMLDGVLKYAVNGDLPNLIADTLKAGDEKPVTEFADFLRQMSDVKLERVEGFEKEVLGKLPDGAVRNMMALIRKTENRQSDADHAEPRRPRLPTAKPDLSVEADKQVDGETAGEIPELPPIPVYTVDGRETTRVEAEDWQTWNATLDNADLSSTELEAYRRMYSNEGGTSSDASEDNANPTVAGITPKTLDDMRTKDDANLGVELDALDIPEGTRPADLSKEQQVAVYRLYMDGNLRWVTDGDGNKIPGHEALGMIGDNLTAAAVADTVFREGRPVGTIIVQKTINDYLEKNGKIKIEQDKKFGSTSLAALQDIVASPEDRSDFLRDLARRRRETHAGGDNARGEAARADSYLP